MENKNQRILGYNSSKGMEYIRVHLKKYDLLMKTFVSPDLNFFQKLWITLDFAFCVVKYGTGINDYFQYQFYKRKAAARKEFIVGRKWHYIIQKCNGNADRKPFDDKSVFNQLYGKFLGRAWLDIELCGYDDFCTFIASYPKSICKIKDGSGGNGIELYESTGNSKKDFKRLKKQKVMLEEIIVQDVEMAAFNPASVNTIRFVTIFDGKTVHLMNAVFRTGNGEGCTDNFHHLGLAALIDIKSGIVASQAVDKNNQRYVFHPRSKKQIVGFKIPHWDKIIQTVRDAAQITPKMRYVGWDIAIQQDGRICIIEGNCASDPDITQMPDQIGKWPMYKKILDCLS